MRHRLIGAGILYLFTTLVGMTSDPAANAQDASGQAPQISQTESLLVAGKVAEAEKTAGLWVAQNPHLSVAYVLLGRVYDAEQRPADAQAAYREAIALAPRSAVPHIALGNSLVKQGQPERGAAEFQHGIDLESQNLTSLISLAALSVLQKDYAKAIKLYLTARRVEPGNPQILLGITNAYFSAGDAKAALEAADALGGSTTAPSSVHNSLGLLLSANAEYQQAIVQFQKANQQGDGSAELFLNMGLAYSHMQEFDKAKECYFQSIELNSDNAAPYVRIGADYLTQNIPPQALAWLTRAVVIDPKDQEGLFLLATALVNGKYYETAQTYLEKYVALRPDDAKGWLLLGDAYLNDEQPESGLKNYKSALALLPHLASAHYLVGYAYYQLSDLTNAEKYLRESLQIDPTLMEAHVWLADIAYRQNQNEDALKELQVIMAARPPSADTSHLLAKIYIRAKRYEEAKKILLDGLQKYPDDQRFHYLLATLYRNTGNTAEAEHELSIYEVAEKMRQLRHKYVRHSFVYIQ